MSRRAQAYGGSGSGGGGGSVTDGGLTTYNHWARRAGIVWTPTGPGGNYTTGITFKLFAPMRITGGACWTVSAGSGTRRVSVWKGSTLEYTEDFAISAGTNWNEFTFAAAVAVGTADLGSTYTIGVWDTAATVYTKVTTTPPAAYANTVAGSYFEYVGVDLFGAGDVRPTFGGGTECYPVEPILGAP